MVPRRSLKNRARRVYISTLQTIKPAYIELYYDRIAPHLKTSSNNNLITLWFLALLIGVSVGAATLLFRYAIGAVQWLWIGSTEEAIGSLLADTPRYMFFLAPIIGGIIVGQILHHFIEAKRPHTVADVIEAKAIKGCHIDTRDGLWSAIVAAVGLGFGASAGREGPVVHLGATLASLLSRASTFTHEHRRIFLASGVAAAVSASFNAPIAGVLFAHEVILAHYGLTAFVPIVLSSVAGSIIVRLTIGEFPAFLIPEYSITSYWEFPAFFLLGLVAAMVSIIFQLSLSTAERVASSFEMPIWLRPIIGGALVGLIALVFPEILGVGYDTTDDALKQNLSLILLFSLLVAKTAATAITLASRFGGGIFSPTLYLGACTGGAYGLIAAAAFPEIASSNGLYAILGMGAVAAATLGAPISTTMIVFELTGGYTLSIALLLTVSISTALTQSVLGMSFFHWQLSTRGIFLFQGPHKEIARTLTVSDFYTPLENPEPLELGEDGKTPPTIRITDNIEHCLRAFDQHGLPSLPVIIDKTDSEIIGHAKHVDALDAYNQSLIRAHEEEHH
ncbi:MAG: chloride channel protein [Rhodomicrobium sp.]|nr:MAG: chloride channel protein [Rhodomicrobium sp.]